MMYGKIPQETLAEILSYIAEKEAFPSLKEFPSISHRDFTESLKVLANELKSESLKKEFDFEGIMQRLDKQSREFLKKLNSSEVKALISRFFS